MAGIDGDRARKGHSPRLYTILPLTLNEIVDWGSCGGAPLFDIKWRSGQETMPTCEYSPGVPAASRVRQLLAARGHVLGAAGASAAAEGPQQHQHQHQQAPTRAPPLATFWGPTRPQTRLQAPPETPVHAGSGGARGGRRRSRCCCVFAHVAAAACRARTHGSPGHNFSTAIAVSEVLKPLIYRAPLARGFWAKNMTPQPLMCWLLSTRCFARQKITDFEVPHPAPNHPKAPPTTP